MSLMIFRFPANTIHRKNRPFNFLDWAVFLLDIAN